MAIYRFTLCISLAVLLGCFSCIGKKGEERPRNMILIIVDTLRQDHLGCYGYDRAHTPSIDQLASGGTRFNQARTAVPLTLPSITSILTSTYPLYHNIKVNGSYTLEDSTLTLAEVFKKNGFRTAAFIGSIALARQHGLYQGFDLYDEEFNEPDHAPDTGAVPLRWVQSRGQRKASEVVDSAIGWLEKMKGEPFFLFLHFFDPHLPYDPPEYLSMVNYAPEETDMLAYDSEVAFVDGQIGRLMAALEGYRLTDETLIVFVADHGEGLKEHKEVGHGHFLYDSTIRVPLIFFFPPLIPAGQAISGNVRTIDITPTILDFFDFDPSEGMQGASLKDQMLGGDEPIGDLSYFETYYNRIYMGWSVLKGIQWRDWKYVKAPRRELYNLAVDSGETMNLIGEHEDIERTMDAKLDSVVSLYSGRSRRISRTIPLDEEVKGLLESLGYFTQPVEMPESSDSMLPDPKDMIDEFNRKQEIIEQIYTSGTLIQIGKYDQSIRILAELRGDGENQWMIDYNLGLAFMGKGDLEKAREKLFEALEQVPVGPERVKVREALRYLETKQ